MAGQYGKKATEKVEKVMKEMKAGLLKSGTSGRKVTNRRQAIAIGLSEARAAGGQGAAAKKIFRETRFFPKPIGDLHGQQHQDPWHRRQRAQSLVQ